MKINNNYLNNVSFFKAKKSGKPNAFGFTLFVSLHIVIKITLE